MSVFILRRFLTLVATLAGASLIIFLVLDALPGNAAQMLMGADASPDAVRALTVKLGLDQPLAVRYLHWIKGLLIGDLGNSYVYGTPVASLIAERLVLTIPLAIMSMLITVTLALSAGIYTAANHNKLGDVGVMSLTQVGIALPNFWFAILLILLFAVNLRWLSAGGFSGWDDWAGAGAQRHRVDDPVYNTGSVDRCQRLRGTDCQSSPGRVNNPSQRCGTNRTRRPIL